MPWARVDDKLHSHPKVRRAWRCRPALGIHLLALSFCMDQGTKGHLTPEWVEDQLPKPAERQRTVDALVEAGLWREIDDGWEVHDFLDWNPSPEDIEARRAADRERKRKKV